MTTRQMAIRVKSDGKAELKRDFQEVGQAGVAAQQQIAGAVDKANAASDRQMEKWRQMARAAKSTDDALQRNKFFGMLGGVGAESGKSAKDSAEAMAAAFAEREAANVNGKLFGNLSKMQRQTLVYTASDIVASAASGASPQMIAMQQGPQVLQAFAVQGGAAMSTLLRLTAVFGPLAAAVGVSAAAVISHRDAIQKLDIVAEGLGITAGLTGEQIDALARKGQQAGGVTVGAAREMASAYLSTGRIGGDVTQTLIGLTQRYAVATGQDAKSATQELAKAMADPAKGADTLNQKLSFLDDTTYRLIRTLVEKGKQDEAQKVLADALSGKLQTVAAHVGVLSGFWDDVKRKASEAWAAMGRGLSWFASNKNDIDLLAEKQRLRAQVASGVHNYGQVDQVRLAELDREIAAIQARLKKTADDAAQADRNKLADAARPVIAAYNPLNARRGELTTQRSTIQAAIDGGALSPEGLKEAQAALKGIDKELAAVGAGYSSAAAQASALKTQQNDAASAARKAAREAEEHAREAARLEDLRLRNLLEIARAAGDKNATEELERQLRVRQLIDSFEQAGVANAKAKAMAERQVGLELVAQMRGRIQAIQDDAKDLKSIYDMLGNAPVIYDANEAALKDLRDVGEQVFDDITDVSRWNDWKDVARTAIQDVTAELFKLAAINPLKNALFGQNNPTLGGSFWSALLGGIPGLFGGAGASGYKSDLGTMQGLPGRNAKGTNDWRGGWTWVGEGGPELVNLPEHAQVLSNAQSMAAGVPVSVSIALDARGAGPSEIQELKREVASLKRQLPGIIVSVSNDAKARRLLK